MQQDRSAASPLPEGEVRRILKDAVAEARSRRQAEMDRARPGQAALDGAARRLHAALAALLSLPEASAVLGGEVGPSTGVRPRLAGRDMRGDAWVASPCPPGAATGEEEPPYGLVAGLRLVPTGGFDLHLRFVPLRPFGGDAEDATLRVTRPDTTALAAAAVGTVAAFVGARLAHEGPEGQADCMEARSVAPAGLAQPQAGPIGHFDVEAFMQSFVSRRTG